MVRRNSIVISPSEMEAFHSASFEDSDFKENSIRIDILRWWRQFYALNQKNLLVLFRRPFQTLSILLIPSLAVIILLLSNQNPAKVRNSNTSDSLAPPTSLNGLGSCNSYYSSNCLQIAFSPLTYPYDEVMMNVAAANKVSYGSDVKGFKNSFALTSYVANNIGTVQFSVFFVNESIWTTESGYYSNSSALSSSYTIFYNASSLTTDPRSSKYGVNFPLLVLQKSIDAALLTNINIRLGVSPPAVEYTADFGISWSFNPSQLKSNPGGTNSTCGETTKDFGELSFAAPFVFSFGFQLVGVLVFQLLIEERHKGLVRSLRRLGLLDTAYWISWLTSTQVLLLSSSILALIVSAIMQSYVYVLQLLDFAVLFLFLWLSLTVAVSNAFFLSSICGTPSRATSIVFVNFFTALLTLIFMTLPLNTYMELSSDCRLVASSYYQVYDSRSGIEFAQFVLFWMPWFHTGQALSSIFSETQYGHAFSSVDMQRTQSVTDFYSPGFSTFQTVSLGYTFGLMVGSSAVYVALSWLFGQLLDGLSLDVILLPQVVRVYVMGSKAIVMDGDVRGRERHLSQEEGSIRAYKVSKTFKGVQALKEVSFAVNKGEVLCLLGHNGAGKSTLFNILSGILQPTHGKVYIGGYDVDYEMKQIQQSIGVCSQDDFFWDELTALEHMRLHALFKGLREGSKLKAACANVLSILGLLDRADTLALNFSGGMKRRLSAAMSIVGNVKILFLDEPTTGLDPISRRAIWNMVSLVKADRVVVLTTHNLEEADYLSDRVLVLHTGQVKAIGDPLSLKQRYGSGYQIRMVVDNSIATAVANDILKFLPRSIVNGGVETGTVVVQVSKQDLLLLTRFLSWLESIKARSEAIKEWVISNTTLEQVFLTLCASSETNYTDPNAATSDPMCILCGQNKPTPCAFLELKDGNMLMIPDALCSSCPAFSFFLLPPADFNPLVQDANFQEKTREIVQSARRKASSLTKIEVSNSYNLSNNNDEGEKKASEELVNTNEPSSIDVKLLETSTVLNNFHSGPLPNETHTLSPDIGATNLPASTVAVDRSLHLNRVGSRLDQVYALMMKNITLQKYQKVQTGCSIILILLTFLIILIIGFLFVPPSICPAGYASTDCSTAYVVSTVFYPMPLTQQSNSLFQASAISRSYGYSTLVYLIPASNTDVSNGYTVKGPFNFEKTIVAYTGVPSYHSRVATAWNPLVNATLTTYNVQSASTGTASNAASFDSLFYPYNTSYAEIFGDDLNQLMYTQQLQLYKDTKNGRYPNCTTYASQVYAPTMQASLDQMAARFADVLYSCPSCKSGQTSFFNGTIWVTGVDDFSQYPYYFSNYKSTTTLNGTCPANTAAMTWYGLINNINNPSSTYRIAPLNNTIQSMTFINLLTNTMQDPTLKSYPIQAGVSIYGSLDFSKQSSTTFIAFLLTMLAVLMMNGLFPMSIWRLSYEKSSNIRLMMETAGLRATSYIIGMYLFDVITMTVLGWFAVIVCVEAKLTAFESAPLGYLIAISLFSSHALSGLSMIVVRISPISPRLTVLVATLVSVSSSVAACLISIILYQEVDSWPTGLSIIPFFAQARAIYRLLIDDKTSTEVNIEIALLFVFGVACLGLELVLDWQLHKYAYHFMLSTLSSLGQEEKGTTALEEQLVVEEQLIEKDIQEEEDVAAARVVVDNLRSLDNIASFAVVFRDLHQEFNIGGAKPLVAVKNLSLALQYGEVFGLLGPNGAGKSTTISILSGTLTPTSGAVYVAGENILQNISNVYRLVGVCPQFDIVWSELSVEEHLFFQARQRGVPASNVYAEVQRVAIQIGLDGDSFRSAAGQLSGGQRRRLSIGMAIIADPPIIILDEPSSGLDPNTRRELWALINKLRRPDRLILLTTHSMEEAEALCSRLGVISEGYLRCLGSGVHLKSKYGTGYTIDVNCMSPVEEHATTSSRWEPLPDGTHRQQPLSPRLNQQEDIDAFMETEIAQINGSRLLAAINHTRRYLIPRNSDTQLSNIFSTMERNKARLGIREWGMAETSLEDIFIRLVGADKP